MAFFGESFGDIYGIGSMYTEKDPQDLIHYSTSFYLVKIVVLLFRAKAAFYSSCPSIV